MQTFFHSILSGAMITVTTVASLIGFVPKTQELQYTPLEKRVEIIESKLAEQSEIPELAGFNATGGGTYRLRSSISSTDTSITLTSFKEPVSNIPYTSTYLGNSTVYGTFEPQTTHSEFISFSSNNITQNTDGTATITGLTRGLLRSPNGSACTASTTLAQRHAGQSIFIISDSPCFFAEYAVKKNNETITGQWSGIEPSSSADFATKNYVDTHVAGGTISVDHVSVAGTAGETVSAGQVLYLKQSDARWYKASVSTAEASTTILGIAQGSGTAGVAISGGVTVHGLDTNQSGLTAGVNYFLGATAGTPGTATSTRFIGKARTSTNIYVDTYSLSLPYLLGTNNFLGKNSFSTSTATTTNFGAFGAYDGIGKQKQILTSTGTSTFAVPVGVSKLWVEVIGPGGTGGGCNVAGTASGAGGGGGGGGYAQEIVDVTGTSSISYHIAASGASNTDWTVFGPPPNHFLSATGGTQPSDESNGGTGGTGAGGDINLVGGGGGAGHVESTARNSSGGNGGNSIFGGGAEGKSGPTSTGAPGTAGSNYGGGGSGAACDNSTSASGGNGAQGLIIVRW